MLFSPHSKKFLHYSQLPQYVFLYFAYDLYFAALAMCIRQRTRTYLNDICIQCHLRQSKHVDQLIHLLALNNTGKSNYSVATVSTLNAQH